MAAEAAICSGSEPRTRNSIGRPEKSAAVLLVATEGHPSHGHTLLRVSSRCLKHRGQPGLLSSWSMGPAARRGSTHRRTQSYRRERRIRVFKTSMAYSFSDCVDCAAGLAERGDRRRARHQQLCNGILAWAYFRSDRRVDSRREDHREYRGGSAVATATADTAEPTSKGLAAGLHPRGRLRRVRAFSIKAITIAAGQLKRVDVAMAIEAETAERSGHDESPM